MIAAFFGLNRAILNLIGEALVAPVVGSFLDTLDPRDLVVDGLAGEDNDGLPDGETGSRTNLKLLRRTGLTSAPEVCGLEVLRASGDRGIAMLGWKTNRKSEGSFGAAGASVDTVGGRTGPVLEVVAGRSGVAVGRWGVENMCRAGVGRAFMDELNGRVGVFGAIGLCDVLPAKNLPFSGERRLADCPNSGARCGTWAGVGFGFLAEDARADFLTGVSALALLAGRFSSSCSSVSWSSTPVSKVGLSFSLVMRKAGFMGTCISTANEAVVLGVKSSCLSTASA